VELFREHYPDIQMMGCFIEGYAVGEELWTRGLVAVLGKFEGEVKVFYERGKDVRDVCERLGRKVGEKWDLMLVMFPWFYFESKLRMAQFISKDKFTGFMYRLTRSVDRKRKLLKSYSDYLEKNLIYPVDKVLIHLSDAISRKFPIIGMNLMPLEAEMGTPIILANYDVVGRGIAGMCFRGEVNAVYHDIFPERGDSFEETVKVLKSYFSDAEEVKVIKEGIAIGEVNGKSAVRFLKDKFEALEEMDEEDFIKKLEEGRFETVSPYGLGFINNNFSASFLGLVNSPISVYPSLMTLNNSKDECLFIGEVFKGGLKKYVDILSFKKLNGLDIFIIDMNTIPAFGGKTYEILLEVRKHSDDLLIFSSPPSSFMKKYHKRSLCEFIDNIYFNSFGTIALIELE
jgi:hypothetical protein